MPLTPPHSSSRAVEAREDLFSKNVPQTGRPGFDEFLEFERRPSSFAGFGDRTKGRFKIVQFRKWVV
jgi:hypothetical protein